jgi:phage virion morphogenesis protein
MTGARLTASLDSAPFRAALAGVAEAVHQPAGLLRAIGTGLAENVRHRMDRGVAPDGTAWKPLSPAYAAMKRGPGILRESLMLQRSITFVASGNTVAIGTNRVYGAVQQFGATIRPKSAKALVFKLGGRLVRAKQVTIPARPYLGLGPEDIETIEDVTWALVRRKLG